MNIKVKIVINATHDESLLKIADKIYEIKHYEFMGRINIVNKGILLSRSSMNCVSVKVVCLETELSTKTSKKCIQSNFV